MLKEFLVSVVTHAANALGYRVIAKPGDNQLPKGEESRSGDPAAPGNVVYLDFTAARRLTDEEVLAADEAEGPIVLTVSLPTRVATRFNYMRRLSGADTNLEIIRRALAFYDTFVTAAAKGGVPGVRMKGEWTEVKLV